MRTTKKMSNIFSNESFCYISGCRIPEKNSLKPETYSEHCETSMMECFAKKQLPSALCYIPRNEAFLD